MCARSGISWWPQRFFQTAKTCDLPRLPHSVPHMSSVKHPKIKYLGLHWCAFQPKRSLQIRREVLLTHILKYPYPYWKRLVHIFPDAILIVASRLNKETHEGKTVANSGEDMIAVHAKRITIPTTAAGYSTPNAASMDIGQSALTICFWFQSHLDTVIQ